MPYHSPLLPPYKMPPRDVGQYGKEAADAIPAGYTLRKACPQCKICAPSPLCRCPATQGQAQHLDIDRAVQVLLPSRSASSSNARKRRRRNRARSARNARTRPQTTSRRPPHGLPLPRKRSSPAVQVFALPLRIFSRRSSSMLTSIGTQTQGPLLI